MLRRAVCLTRNRAYFSSYRTPVNFLNYLEKYTEEHNPNKSPSIVENYKALKAKLSECEELQTFVNNSEDKELRDIAALDIEDVTRDIEQIVDSVRDELGWLAVTSSFCQAPLISLLQYCYDARDDYCDSSLFEFLARSMTKRTPCWRLSLVLGDRRLLSSRRRYLTSTSTTVRPAAVRWRWWRGPRPR